MENESWYGKLYGELKSAWQKGWILADKILLRKIAKTELELPKMVYPSWWQMEPQQHVTPSP